MPAISRTGRRSDAPQGMTQLAAVVLCVLGASIAILCSVVSDALAADTTSAEAVAAPTRVPASTGPGCASSTPAPRSAPLRARLAAGRPGHRGRLAPNDSGRCTHVAARPDRLGHRKRGAHR